MPAAAQIIVSSVISGSLSSQGVGRASRLAAEGTEKALAQREKFFDIGQEQMAPYREIGNEALDKIRNVFVSGDMDEFYESADYQFNLAEGEKALARKQGAAGSRYGGRALKEASQFAQGTASQEFGNFFNRLNTVAGMGLTAATQGAAQATSTGAGMAGITQAGAGAQAGLAIEQAQGMNQAIQGGISNLSTLQTYNDLKSALTPNYASGNVTSKPSIFNQ